MDETLNARHMSMDRIIEQLAGMKDNSTSFASAADAQRIIQDDVTALEASISIMSALQDEGIDDVDGLMDLIFDYNGLVNQSRESRRKFEVAAKAVYKDGLWHCPECNHRVSPRHSHCHWCGKKLGGW
jgi:hypothetical protein